MIPALSIRQPWAWAIMNGKPIENRDWPTKFRGRVLVHASKTCTKAEYEAAAEFINGQLDAKGDPLKVPPLELLDRGGIIGSVEIVDCVTESDSQWFFGQYGFVLRDPKHLPFTPIKGRLGFFNVNPSELKGGAL